MRNSTTLRPCCAQRACSSALMARLASTISNSALPQKRWKPAPVPILSILICAEEPPSRNASAAAAVGPGAISIATGGKANLNYTGSRSIASLTLGGVLQPAGAYGSNASSAANKSDTYFTSTGVGVLNVLLIPTTTAVTSNLTPAMTGSAVTFTATVTGGTPTGSVTFYDGPTALGTSPLNGTFQATLTRSNLTAGTHTITAQYSGDPSHATSTSAGFSQVLILSPFDSWTVAQGLPPDPLDDSDHDGVSNLLEYATKMNPSANDATPQSATKTGSDLEFIYTKNKSATDVTFTVEWSDDFTTWSTVGVTQSLIPGSDNGVTQQWKAVMPAGSSRRFTRLKVTRP